MIELKQMIQAKDAEEKSTLSMEKELKETLRALDDTKKVLSCKEQQVENLETRLKSLEQTAKFLEILQKDKEEQQSEREKLRKINDMLKEDLATKEREMEEFKKNRNETLNKYDNLIKSLQEDVDRQKREVRISFVFKEILIFLQDPIENDIFYIGHEVSRIIL